MTTRRKGVNEGIVDKSLDLGHFPVKMAVCSRLLLTGVGLPCQTKRYLVIQTDLLEVQWNQYFLIGGNEPTRSQVAVLRGSKP
jgi:hypothetical protein